jgi:protoporphyrinogen oxidase
MTAEKKKNVVILGAGVGGLSAGYFLAKTGKFNVVILEKELHVGGLCSSFNYDGFTFDYGAHKLYSVIPGIMEEIEDIMKDRIIKLPKKNRLFLREHFVDYPLKLGNLAKVLGFGMFLKIGFGYGLVLIKGLFIRKEAGSYEEFMIGRFGKPAYDMILGPLADKVWGDPSTLHPNMARTRVPASGGLELILKLIGMKKETAHTNAEYFYYPKKGFGDFPGTLKEKIENAGGKVLTGTSKIEPIIEGAIMKKVKAKYPLIDGI